MIDRQPCGCKHDGAKWVFLCEPCRTEFEERHGRAAQDHYQTEGAKRVKGIL